MLSLTLKSGPGASSRGARQLASHYRPHLPKPTTTYLTSSAAFSRRHQRRLSTFANQDQLPRLPVPSLEATAERYLRSISPINTTPERQKQSEEAVSAFVAPGKGFGHELQTRLEAHDRAEPYSWLEDIWLNKGYLEWREPIFINVSWWAQFVDSPTLGVLAGANRHPAPGQFTEVQLKRASALIQYFTIVSDKLNKEEVPPEYLRKQPLDMNQYRYQFSTTRIAAMPKDHIVHQHPTPARHIIVMARDQVFQVEVLGPRGEVISQVAIQEQLRQVVKQVEALPELDPAVGSLTTTNRDIWAQTRDQLRHQSSASAVHRTNFTAIDSALFAVCLDDQVDPATAVDINRSKDHFFHNFDGRNRWMDKSLQIIVLNNGRAGVNGEHTASDAATPGGIFNAALMMEEKSGGKDLVPSSSGTQSLTPPRHLRWQVEPSTRQAIADARQRALATSSQLGTELAHFNDYGAQWIKQAQFSPDSFLQMALQLAYYRLHRQPCPTYETASIRTFLHGRTETCRSFSPEAAEFVHKFMDPSTPTATKVHLLQRAITAHRSLMLAASEGQGVDRHLLGLRSMIRNPEEQARATLFNDPTYLQSISFILSTSNLSPGTYFYGGFAPGVAEGYGSNYSIGPDGIKLSVSSWKGLSQSTDAGAFKDAILDSLRDIQAVVDQSRSAST
ncbi:Carnitine O-acetyltransferase mitochondrial [Dimargaris cristalligena]|uniref:Acyltransferase ChoActase/COT/CPT n=1 Tax=Dimargaris cristalligena TaxID=215637 RepID=A0A4Q0A0T8_9FUNG|nr:Carnitine O-acetyltransferase mitochondrial [Dimargaris cristalligena]RKP39627.1 acyltransferase ChoActase/COT/CPT [Dimargaris cristalligena]|eukprot:RKP39627.1 acyltransferase ChoActase/COT/CPT [Dimargaris cristalligena]